MDTKCRLVIAGLSSYLGRQFIDLVLDKPVWEIGGFYRTYTNEMGALIRRCVATGSDPDWFIECDLSREPETFAQFDILMPVDSVPLTFVYMCGAWHHGPVTLHTAEDVSKVINIGLKSPIYYCSQIFRMRKNATAATRCVIVTGLGGERAGVRYSSLYGSATGGIYNYIRATGMELAGTNMSCVGLALGLFDKGQPYIHSLCEHLVIRRPTPLGDVLEVLSAVGLSYRSGYNGSVVEVGGGLMNYQDVAVLLTEKAEL